MADECFEAMSKARNQSESGNVKGAVETLEDYLKKDPHNTEPRFLLAKICAVNKMKEYALIQLEVILDLEPDNFEARKAMITLLKVDKKNNDETKKHFEYLAEKCPGDAELFNSFAIFCKMQLTDYKKAAENYEKAIKINPDNASYRINYSILLVKDLKDYQKGKEQLEIGLRLDPSNQRAKDAYERLVRKKFDKEGNPKKGFFSFLRK